MVSLVDVKKIREGDWLYKDFFTRVGKNKRVIKARWEGLSEEEIGIIRREMRGKKVKIRRGVPFGPVFLTAYCIYFLWILF
jgi:prepilin signal peptidase PulO-like enzyme (type II secretory pathway)